MTTTTVLRGLLRGGPLRRAALVVLSVAASLSSPPVLAGQEVAAPGESLLRGRVLLGSDPIEGSQVTLHRVTPQAAGEVGTTVTDAAGAFGFPVTPVAGADFTLFFVTAEHLGVRFFGPVVSADESESEYVVAVYDTTSVLGEPVRILSRDAFFLPESSGSWDVTELIRIFNPTATALVSAEGMPTWEFRIPTGASDFEVGPGDLLPHDVSWMDDRVMLVTPVIPGDRVLLIRYRLPAGPAAATLAVDVPTDTLNVFFQEPSHIGSVEGLFTTRRVDLEGEQFLQYGGTDFDSGATIRFRWDRLDGLPIDPVLGAVAVTLLLLAAGLTAAVRNHRRFS